MATGAKNMRGKPPMRFRQSGRRAACASAATATSNRNLVPIVSIRQPRSPKAHGMRPAPACSYPHFLGFSDERGERSGEGFNLNIQLGIGTNWHSYSQGLARALHALRRFTPDVLLVSLGLDTFEFDPISQFALKTEDYLRLGEAIALINLPTLFVFEGGYNIEALGEITVNVLEGFAGR